MHKPEWDEQERRRLRRYKSALRRIEAIAKAGATVPLVARILEIVRHTTKGN